MNLPQYYRKERRTIKTAHKCGQIIGPLSGIWLSNLIRGQNSHDLAQVGLYTFLSVISWVQSTPSPTTPCPQRIYTQATLHGRSVLPVDNIKLKKAISSQEVKMPLKGLNALFIQFIWMINWIFQFWKDF